MKSLIEIVGRLSGGVPARDQLHADAGDRFVVRHFDDVHESRTGRASRTGLSTLTPSYSMSMPRRRRRDGSSMMRRYAVLGQGAEQDVDGHDYRLLGWPGFVFTGPSVPHFARAVRRGVRVRAARVYAPVPLTPVPGGQIPDRR